MIGILICRIRKDSPATKSTAFQNMMNVAFVTTSVTEMKLQLLQLDCVFNDDVKNYYKKEKQPTIETTESAQAQDFCLNDQ
jgi:hypothetical protein